MENLLNSIGKIFGNINISFNTNILEDEIYNLCNSTIEIIDENTIRLIGSQENITKDNVQTHIKAIKAHLISMRETKIKLDSLIDRHSEEKTDEEIARVEVLQGYRKNISDKIKIVKNLIA